ncbi:MAG TPA: AAA family ATPase [Thermoplasmata archaeon]|nr:AAA family ATPase [Thermoplasmata archaeon]
MHGCAHPEVLANDWLPPVAIGREAEVADVVRRLDPPAPRAPAPWIVGVVGPSGSGTSTVARRAAREVADRLRSARVGPSPRFLSVRAASVRGTHGVASALLQRLDEGFDGRGFPVTEILAGLLRRLRRERRPTVLLLDDIKVGGPDLGPVVRAVADPDRFLPEGESGLPPVWTILAGEEEAMVSQVATFGDRCPVGPFVPLRPYSEPALFQIVRDRLERASARPPPDTLVHRIVRRTVEEGGGVGRAMELLRRELLGSVPARRGELRFFGGRTVVAVEPRVVRAIGAAVERATAGVGDVRRFEAELARSEGLRPLPTTTLWRRIVRLEQAGYVRREIRTGGTGGTRSVVRLLTPIDEWVTAPFRPDTPRAVGPTGGPGPAEGPSARGLGSLGLPGA